MSVWPVAGCCCPPVIAVTDSGLYTATMLLARVATSVSIVLLITLTTRWADLLKGLEKDELADEDAVDAGSEDGREPSPNAPPAPEEEDA